MVKQINFMENLNKEILFLLSKNLKGLKITEIIDYVDYKQKIALSEQEIGIILDELLQNNKIKKKSNKYFKI
jgi:hypothetical protein